MIESTNIVNVQEIDGKEPRLLDPLDTKKLRVSSHTHWNHLVVLQHGDTGESIAVNGKDLITAIGNAMNVNRRT